MEQFKCPSTDERLDDMRTSVQRNIMQQWKRMKSDSCEDVSKRAKREKPDAKDKTLYDSVNREHLERADSQRQKTDWRLPGYAGEWLTAHVYLFGGMKMFWIYMLMIVAKSSECTKMHWNIHFSEIWGTCMARSVEWPTLGFGSGHDLTLMRQAPWRALRWQRGDCLGFSPPLSLPFPRLNCLSLSK